MPISEARSNAARINGAKSRGPVSAEGKARSAQNSRRHGVLSSAFTLRTENHPALQTLEEKYLAEWQPVDEHRVRSRVRGGPLPLSADAIVAVEVAAWDLQMDKDAADIEQRFNRPPDNAVRSAIAFDHLANEGRTLDLTHRYETRFHRQYYRALNELKDLQDRRFGFGRYFGKVGMPESAPPAGHRFTKRTQQSSGRAAGRGRAPTSCGFAKRTQLRRREHHFAKRTARRAQGRIRLHREIAKRTQPTPT